MYLYQTSKSSSCRDIHWSEKFVYGMQLTLCTNCGIPVLCNGHCSGGPTNSSTVPLQRILDDMGPAAQLYRDLFVSTWLVLIQICWQTRLNTHFNCVCVLLLRVWKTCTGRWVINTKHSTRGNKTVQCQSKRWGRLPMIKQYSIHRACSKC